MKLPRDVSGADLIRALGRIGYTATRTTGSHVRLTIQQPSQHHVTVPAHDPLKVGTLAAILSEVATHLEIDRAELVHRLFKD
jgi:predicted RNA binding protein YcfA (HicA-like mRNA interferase family)